ncbi:MAG: histidine kinase [Roseivirga sp.]|nr:histidine kinase [Roseivirga sp.]
MTLTRKVLLEKLTEAGVHLLFWSSVFLFYLYVFGYNSTQVKFNLVFSSFLMPITMASCYAVVYYLIPKYLILKRYRSFLLYSIYTFVLTAFAVIVSVFYALIFILDLRMAEMPVARSLPFVLITVYLVIFLGSGIALLRHYYNSNSRNDKLKNKVLETQLKLKEQELKYLKMQIHPHFLFNTLNTLYGFAMTKADETPEVILRLSNLLDYLLYQVDKPLVSLLSEIHHIEDYIALERIRFSDSLDLDFRTENISEELQVAPMLLIPFIENGFKHGRSNHGKLHIEINLREKAGKVFFTMANSVKTNVDQEESSGIGLKNIKQRLEMVYPQRHSLSITSEENEFRVELMIDTNG